QGDCSQPSTGGCPLQFGQAVTSAIRSTDQVDTWLLQVPTPGDLSVLLSNLPVDYDVHIYTRDGALVTESQNEGTTDDLVKVQGAAAGDYLVYVNSARGQVSDASYT